MLPNLAALRPHDEAPTAVFRRLSVAQAERRDRAGHVCPITREVLEANKGRGEDGATFMVKRRSRRRGRGRNRGPRYDWFDAEALARSVWADVEAGRPPRNPVNRERLYRRDIAQLQEAYPRQLSPEERLFEAIDDGDTNAAVDALEAGASLRATMPYEGGDVTPLGLWANVFHCPIAILDAMQARPDFQVDAPADAIGSPALQVAIYSDFGGVNKDKVVALIAAGANVDATNNYGDRALFVAASGSLEHMIEAVWPHVTDVNAVNLNNETALFIAVFDNVVENVKKLIELSMADGNPLDLDSPSLDFASPLHVAIAFGDVDVARVLIDAGADVNKTWEGSSLLDIAKAEGDDEIIRMIRSRQRSRRARV